jgi:predicted glycoside hydrolase/deacetylase ChbG (UPF0249 family)/DNA-binding beta-propeller fold protein YncE
MIRLVVNADDLGFSKQIDDGIFEAADRGIVTSVSMLVVGTSFESAYARLRGASLGVGVHLAAVGGFVPASPPSVLPHLCEGGRLLRSWKELAGRLVLRPGITRVILAEFEAQLARARDAGPVIDHVDAHQHLHMWPSIFPGVEFGFVGTTIFVLPWRPSYEGISGAERIDQGRRVSIRSLRLYGEETMKQREQIGWKMFVLSIGLVFLAGCGSGGGKSKKEATTGSESPKGVFFTDWRRDRLVRVDDMTGGGWESLGGSGSGEKEFTRPAGLAFDPDGLININDLGNGRIVRTADLSGAGWNISGIDLTPSPDDEQPAGIAIDPDGRIYFSDWVQHRIVRSDDFEGNSLTSPFGAQGAGVGEFNEPAGVALDSQGRIYVADSGNDRIVRIDGINGAGWIGNAGENCLGGGIDQPLGIALDSSDRIYVADHLKNRIVRLDDLEGTTCTVMGSLGDQAGQFDGPVGIAVDAAGRIYIADKHNARIVRVDDMDGTGWIELKSPDNIPIRPVGIIVR